MTDLFPINLDDMIQEAEREVVQRRRVYRNLVADGKMTQKLANWRTSVMEQIVMNLKDQRRGAV